MGAFGNVILLNLNLQQHRQPADIAASTFLQTSDTPNKKSPSG
jgi:hypothetical protein